MQLTDTELPEEYDRNDPLGIIRIEYETERETTLFCEHISSIPGTGKELDINHCGAMFKL